MNQKAEGKGLCLSCLHYGPECGVLIRGEMLACPEYRRKDHAR
jgi:hypothetical protein